MTSENPTDIDFKTALMNTNAGLDAIFSSLSSKSKEHYDLFKRINKKFQILSSSFGFIEGNIPDSKALNNDKAERGFIDSLEIFKYKKINNAKINFLNKINVFAGGNNSGKSTLAEIFYLIAKGTDPLGVTDIVKLRREGDSNYNNTWLSEYLEYNVPLDCNYTMKYFSNGMEQTESNHFSIASHNNKTDLGNEEKGLGLSNIYIELKINIMPPGTTAPGLPTQIKKSLSGMGIYQKRISLFDDSQQIRPVTYVTSQTTFKYLVFDESWTKVVMHIGGKSLIIQFLKETFIADLKDINYVNGSKDGMFLFELESGKVIHIFDFGDGVQRCFAIALQAFAAKNGFLIIDELENGIHHSNFRSIARFLMKLQEELNLQIFITSHSLEAIKDMVNEIPPEIVSYHELYERDKVTKIESYKGEDYKFAYNETGMDLRG